MVLKVLEFGALSSIISLNRDLEMLEMADLQGEGKQSVCDMVRPAPKGH